MMKSVMIFVLLGATAVGLVTARSDLDLLRAIETIEAQEVYDKACCNECGECDRRHPDLARCVCDDLVLQCHPSCRKCVQSPFRIYPPRYRCMDMSYKACHRNCNPATAASKSVD